MQGKKKKNSWEAAAAATAPTAATAARTVATRTAAAISPFFDASGNKNISATIRIG